MGGLSIYHEGYYESQALPIVHGSIEEGANVMKMCVCVGWGGAAGSKSNIGDN